LSDRIGLVSEGFKAKCKCLGADAVALNTHETSEHHKCDTNLFQQSLRNHLVISFSFTSYRLAHKNDCLDKKLYPLLMHKHRIVTQKCAVCHVFIGRCVKIRGYITGYSVGLWKPITYPTCDLFSDGTPPTTGSPPVIRVCSVTNASGCCTTMPKATNWESSWLILTLIGVRLTNVLQ